MKDQLQTLDRDSLVRACGGAGAGGSKAGGPRLRVEGASPVDISPDEINTPVFGRNGQLSPLQTRTANAAWEARKHLNSQGRSSNSGAVESRQWRAMVNAIEAE